MEYVVRVSGSQKITPKVININGSDDSFYRYKMRQLYVQVVGKGKMIKTTLLNVDDVSRDLKVPPSFMTAYIGYEIGTPSKFDAKKPERERGSISGEYDPSYLSTIVKKMIDEFILCGKCGLPECSVAVDQKTKKITMECRGCGGSSTPVLNDKFQKFILNNEVKLKEVKALEKTKKPDQAAVAAAAAAASTTSSGSTPKPKKEKAKGPDYDASNFKNTDDDDDDDWAASTSEEAIRERQMKLLPEKLKALVVDPNAEKRKEPENGLSPKNLDGLFSEFASNHSKQELFDEIKKVQKEHKFDNAKRTIYFFNNALPKGQDVSVQFSELKPLLKNILTDEQSHSAAVQWLDASCEDEANSSKIANILKTLYDDELIEEEPLLKWHASAPSTPHGAAVRTHLNAFVEWLKNAEEESDDE
eukprot:TRINITY_DN27_c0_g1_i1.p1 TRINITY_DN27_c0_g1~~TRINITY_DN27_c0_g1_i1.p1  ORF type:complete len:417 (+),score=116.62 TRINITY_DN27_c0_g1_i1:169-1419(+)